MGEPGITTGADMIGDMVDEVTRSITKYGRDSLSDVTSMIADPIRSLCTALG